MTTKKTKQKTWHQLKQSQCPNCGIELQKGMFSDGFITCGSCGFAIKEKTKDLLIKRDHE